jgi:hypothetical protein
MAGTHIRRAEKMLIPIVNPPTRSARNGAVPAAFGGLAPARPNA